jgi:hypothetical protein
VRFRRVERTLVSHDPHRRAILARIRWIRRHLHRRGVLLFFDVQPLPVQAYGGRRFTSAKGLVLEKAQKTRGFFYLLSQLKNASPCASCPLEPGRMSARADMRHHSGSHQKPVPFLRRSHDEPNEASVVPGAHHPR